VKDMLGEDEKESQDRGETIRMGKGKARFFEERGVELGVVKKGEKEDCLNLG